MKNLLMFLGLLIMFTSSAIADTFLIDVRSAAEYNEEHINKAINIPHTQILDGVKELNAKNDDTIILYCRSGKIAGMAKEALNQAGYTKVINLGGLQDAKEALKTE